MTENQITRTEKESRVVERPRGISAEASRKNESESREDERPSETVVEFLSSIAGLLATVLFIMTFVFQTFAIPSSSMENTLLIGDHVLVDRESFAPPTRWLAPVVPYRNLHRG